MFVISRKSTLPRNIFEVVHRPTTNVEESRSFYQTIRRILL